MTDLSIMTNDLALYFYAFGGLVLVFVCFVIFAVVTEFFRSLNKKYVEQEKKKKQEAVKARYAA